MGEALGSRLKGAVTSFPKLTMRNRQLGVIGAFFLLIFCFYSISRTSPGGLRTQPKKSHPRARRPETAQDQGDHHFYQQEVRDH